MTEQELSKYYWLKKEIEELEEKIAVFDVGISGVGYKELDVSSSPKYASIQEKYTELRDIWMDKRVQALEEYIKIEKYMYSVDDEELKKLEHEMYEHYGVRPIIYTNKDCYKLYIVDHFPESLIWMSDLHNEPNIKENDWVIWQFSRTGNINGINGDIDLNYFRYSFRQFNQLLMP